MLDGIELTRISSARMRYLSERQGIIARNIANADTPGFRAQDLRPFSFESRLLAQGNDMRPLTIARTNSAHLGLPSAAGIARLDRAAAAYGEKPNGNTVNLEEQMVKAADTNGAHELATATYRRSNALLRMAASGGSR